MRRLVRGWILKLKRRRVHREMRAQGNYGALERSVRAGGNVCSNCNVTLTGPFCHICGQKDDDLDRPIWTLLREILDDTFSTDSRLLKTLFLLVLVPGGLTRAFRMGRRARFVPPLRLYFVVSIMFFLLISVADILILDIHVTPVETEETADEPGSGTESETGPETNAEEESTSPTNPPATAAQTSPESSAETPAEMHAETPSEAIEPGDRPLPMEAIIQDAVAAANGEEVEQTPEQRARELLGDRFDDLPAETKEAIINAKPGDPINIDGDDVAGALIGAQFDRLADSSEDDDEIDISIPYDFDIRMFVRNPDDDREGFKQEDIDKVLNDPSRPAALKQATLGFAAALKDPKEFNDLFNDWLPRALFVLMPFFALLLRVFHWRRDQRYLQQIVFSLHFHTFLFLLLAGLMIIVPRFGGELGFSVFWWGTSVYLIIALKVGQGQGWIKAFLKAGFIWVGYFIVMLLTMMAVTFFGLGDVDIFDLMRGDTSAFEIVEEAPARDGQEPRELPGGQGETNDGQQDVSPS